MFMDPMDFEEFWTKLPTRTKGQVSALHYLVQRDGSVLCLDTNTCAGSEASVDKLVDELLRAAGPDDILPYSPRERWDAFAAHATPHMSASIGKFSHRRRRAILGTLRVTIVSNDE